MPSSQSPGGTTVFVLAVNPGPYPVLIMELHSAWKTLQSAVRSCRIITGNSPRSAGYSINAAGTDIRKIIN